MFYSIYLDENDAKLIRFLHKDPRDKEAPINVIQMDKISMGAQDSQFNAIMCLREIAKNCYQTHKEVSLTISNDLYADDIVSGCENPKKGINLIKI